MQEPTLAPVALLFGPEYAGNRSGVAVAAAAGYGQDVDFEPLRRVVSIVVPIIFGIISILGLIGNLLVVIVVAFNPSMRSTTNILIINLALADLLFVIFCIPFTATDYVLPWPFGNVWCKCVQYLIIVTACASVYTLVLMSFDRYLAVVHPISSRSIKTEKHAIFAICAVWIVILTGSIPGFIIHGELDIAEDSRVFNESVTLDEDELVLVERLRNSSWLIGLEEESSEEEDSGSSVSCRILRKENYYYFQVIFFLVSYVVPLLLIGGLYLCMLMRLWQGPRISAESRRGRKRVTRLVAVVVGVFAFSWLPIHVVLICKSLDAYPINTPLIIVQIVSHVLAYANSCINPILYAFFSENFRKAFYKIIYCRDRQEQQNRPVTRTTRIPSSGQIL